MLTIGTLCAFGLGLALAGTPDDHLHGRADLPALHVHGPWWGYPPYAGYYPPYTGYWYSPCYPFASCAALLEYRLMERRFERFEDLRRESRPARPPAALPQGPPSPESELQPQYRDSGTVRPEFQSSGQWRAE